MSRLAKQIPSAAAIEDKVRQTGNRGLELVSNNLPKVADATDRVGKAVADFVTVSSRSLADKLRSEDGGAIGRIGTSMGATWIVQRAGRIVRRNPGAVLIGGAVIAAIGISAWLLTRPDSESEAEAA